MGLKGAATTISKPTTHITGTERSQPPAQKNPHQQLVACIHRPRSRVLILSLRHRKRAWLLC